MTEVLLRNKLFFILIPEMDIYVPINFFPYFSGANGWLSDTFNNNERGKKEKVFEKKVLEACSFTQHSDGAGWDDADGSGWKKFLF